MKLYNWPTSPFGAKVRTTLKILGLYIEEIPCHPWERKTPLTSLNPLTKIPTLVMDDGTALYDSPVICEYLASLGSSSLFPDQKDRRFIALRQQALADGLMEAAIAIRYETHFRAAHLQSKDWIQRQQRSLRTGVQFLTKHAQDLPPPSLEKMTIGGIASFVALDYLMLRFPEEKWMETGSQIKDWYNTMTSIRQIKEGRPQDSVPLPDDLEILVA